MKTIMDIKNKIMITKIIKKTILSFAILCLIASCSDDEQANVYQGGSFISFGDTNSGTKLESSTEPITITAYASVPNNQNEISVDFSIEITNGTDADYIVIDNKTSFNFDSDNYSDSIEILPVNNLDEDGDKTITVTLTSNSAGYTLGFPGPDANGKVFTFVIEDDDCAFTLEELGTASWSGFDNVPSNQAGPNASMITTSFDGTNVLFEGIGYGWLTDTDFWDEVIVTSQLVTSDINPITGEITIAQQPLCETTWLGDPQPAYSIVGSGQYVSCSETLVINYDIIQNGGVLRSFSETLIKN